MPENKIPERFKDEPRVTLGGSEWAIPPLSGRRVIRFGALMVGVTVKRGADEASMMRAYEGIYQGISQGLEDPKALTFDDWLDSYPITYDEILSAIPVIAKQAGMEFKAAAVEDSQMGEGETGAIQETDSLKTGTM